MASLKYRIVHMDFGENKLAKGTPIADKSKKMYMNCAVKFGQWCKEEYRCKTPEECLPHLQDYADWLVSQGKTPSTIHTYLAGTCRWFGVSLDKIQKPKRVVSKNIRSRGTKAVDGRSDAQREASPRLYDFALAVGIRRDEYRRLRRNDLVIDESGCTCVRVRRGKGGKYQEQRIAPEELDFVRSFFDGSDGPVFAVEELRNKIDLHHLRALRAQRAYKDYMSRLAAEPAYRAQLTEEMRLRWERLCGRRWDPKRVQGTYWIRGGNRQLAIRHGLPTSYDRLAVMAVSVFHLSHWRCDVTVGNYLLAV